MTKKALKVMERFHKTRYFIALWLLICIIWVVVEACCIHLVIWDNFFYYPEEAYQSLEQEILSSDNIFNEEFKNKYDVELLETSYTSNKTRAKIKNENVSVYVWVTNYNLPDQKVIAIERSMTSKWKMILGNLCLAILIFGIPSIVCAGILAILYLVIYAILEHKVKKQGKHFIE